jgi:hypothetical protein
MLSLRAKTGRGQPEQHIPNYQGTFPLLDVYLTRKSSTEKGYAAFVVQKSQGHMTPAYIFPLTKRTRAINPHAYWRFVNCFPLLGGSPTGVEPASI